MNNHRFSWVIAVFFLFSGVGLGWASEAPGKPGIPHRWGPALKEAIGTSSSAHSPVWFTIAEGILTEVYYPTVDHPQVGDLQFIVTDGASFFSEQKRDTISQVSFHDEGMAVEVQGTQKDKRYSFVQTYVTDPEAAVVRVHTHFVPHQSGLRLFVLFKPALDNAGAGDLGFANQQGLFASGKQAHTALVSSVPWRQNSVGYVGFSDGWQELARHFELAETYSQAGPGNIALAGEIKLPSARAGVAVDFDLALGFGATPGEAQVSAQTSLATPFSQIQGAYESGWKKYAASLSAKSPVSRQSAQLIKMHEDKQYPGAIVASLSKPSLPGPAGADDDSGGYHLVWPRDLYHAAMGLLAAGDAQTPQSVLRYYERTQKKDGSWNQNFWVTGEPYWTGLQMDEVAFPILLAAKLSDNKSLSLKKKDISMVCNAARFLVNHGPTTGQDRWEEIGGFVPSTIAAEIAALRAADRMVAQQCADVPMRATADLWASRLEEWMVVSNGPHGEGYYLRSSPGGHPNAREKVGLANGAGDAFADEILDGGFLDLVRLGVRGSTDSAITKTLEIYDRGAADISAPVKGVTGGRIFRRYNRDAYGPKSVGGFWPLLAGERGHFSIATGDFKGAKTQLELLEASALSSGLIPEQVVSQSRTHVEVGGGVACPLVWAHAEQILLQRSIEEGVVFDSPRDAR